MKKLLILLVMLLGCSTWAQSVPFAFVQGPPSSGGRAFNFVNDLDVSNADAATNYMTLSAKPIPNLCSNLTVSFWIKRRKSTVNHGNILFSETDATGNHVLYVYPILYQTYEGAYSASLSINIPTNNPVWQHVVFSISSNRWTGYKNAVAVTSLTTNLRFPNSLTFARIGNQNSPNYGGESLGLRATIDDLAIWTNALTAIDVTNIYNAGTPPYTVTTGSPYNTNTLVALWTFDQPDGSTACTSLVNRITNIATVVGPKNWVDEPRPSSAHGLTGAFIP